MSNMIDISASFDSDDLTATSEAITAFLEAAKTSDDEPLLEVLHCAVIPDLAPEHQEANEAHAVIRARSARFDAESLKPWLNRLLNDVREGQPTLRSVDVVNAVAPPAPMTP